MSSNSVSFKRLAFGLLALAMLICGLWFWNSRASETPKTKVALMSSISLKWGEASMEEITRGETSPALFYQMVNEAHNVTMLDTLSLLAKANPDVLVLVQPRMLDPEELVALDKWIRNGGRALIFADPALQWPTSYPMGDNRRPLFTSFLSPLFAYWGIELILPVESGEEQSATVRVADQALSVVSRGNWIRKTSAQNAVPCRIDKTALVATCQPGKGRVVLFADADMLYDDNLGSRYLSSSQSNWLLRLLRSQAENSPLPAGL